jgi:hypothetical protein
VQFLHLILASAHVLAGAAWFGAMFYSLMVLHPRARLYFNNPNQFEEFIGWLAAGARWKVLGGATFVGLTGAALYFLSEKANSATWNYLMAAKTIVFLIAVGIFCFASWKLWPARILTSSDEIPAFQKKFRCIAITLLLLVGANMVLGVISSHL